MSSSYKFDDSHNKRIFLLPNIEEVVSFNIIGAVGRIEKLVNYAKKKLCHVVDLNPLKKNQKKQHPRHPEDCGTQVYAYEKLYLGPLKFLCGKFYNNYGRTTDSSINDFVYNVICSKLKGNVGNFLMCRPDLTSWPLIKEALREHYGDRIDRQTLTREFLQLNRHRNENIVDFLERLKLMKSQVEVKIQTDELLNDGQKVILMNQNELNALDVLSANTDDNLRLLLDLKQPNTLTTASDVVIRHFHNEMRINSLSRRQNNNFHPTAKTTNVNRKPQPRTYNNFVPSYQSSHQQPSFQNLQQQYFQPTPKFYTQPTYQQQHDFSKNENVYWNKPQFPSQPINIQPKQIPQKFLTNRQVFGKPNNGSNVFSPKNSHKPNHPPEPMDTSSRNTRFSRNNAFRPSGPPNFTAEELYNAEMGKPMINQYHPQINYSQEPHYSELSGNQYTLPEEYQESSYEPKIDLFQNENESYQNFRQTSLREHPS
ncbi:hypothetical protein ABEB36_012372 [Hypothenemus hampei]|uniref:Retrotransposon gag domain-containing protein n=1 Tax=Hypothenemus hampei TaxID=57062 RepID=A0ABD1ECZ7_HYPHA